MSCVKDSRFTFLACLALTLPALACAGDAVDPIGPIDGVERVDLRQALSVTDASVVGVTVEPTTGRVLVLDDQRGIYAVSPASRTGEWVTERVIDLADLPPADAEIASPFTDLAAIAPGRIALTARNDGFLLDLDAHTLSQYFCYVPPAQEESIEQLTLSVTYDVSTDHLYAQPQTFNLEGDLLASQVGEFDRQTGFDMRWFTLNEASFLAGGIAAESREVLLLGHEHTLYRYDLTGPEMRQDTDLSAFGVVEVAGLAITPDSLLVIDGQRDELVMIDRDEL